MARPVHALTVVLEDGLSETYVDTLVAAIHSFRGIVSVDREQPESMEVHVAQIRAAADLRQRVLAALRDAPWKN